jgi:adenine phosphoribosyltransferase
MTDDPRREVIRKAIRAIPDFPKPGILFRDITPLLGDPEAFRATIDLLHDRYVSERIDRIVALESRGFLFGAALGLRLGVGLAPIRKKGKLPGKKVSVSYALEYGTDTLEMHEDALSSGARVLIVDDLLATGGTAAAAAELVAKVGGQVVGASFVIELGFLNGRDKLKDIEAFSILTYV